MSTPTIPFGALHQLTLNDSTKIPSFAWGNGSGNARKTALVSGEKILRAGIRHIDTAQGYKTEAETGQAITAAVLDKRQVYVTSKISGPDFSPVPASEVRSHIEAAIEKLGFIPDLYLIHNPFVIKPSSDLKEAWKIMEQMKDEGRLKSIGVSNFRPQDLQLILDGAKYVPAVNQVEFHPYVLSHLEPVLELHTKHNIVTAAYGPLTPLLRHPSKESAFLAGGHGGGPLLPVLKRIAARINESHPTLPLSASNRIFTVVDEMTVLLLWTQAMGAVAISASGSEKNIKRLGEIAVLSPSLLTAEEVEEIARVGKSVHFRHYREHMENDFPLPDLPSGSS